MSRAESCVPLPTSLKLIFLPASCSIELDTGVGAHDEVEFLVEQLCDVDDLVIDAAYLIAAARRAEQDRLRDAEIDALEEAHIAEVLPAALADHRQDTEFVAVVEHGRQIVGDRQIRGVEIARDDRDRIRVDALTDRAQIGLVGNRRPTTLRSGTPAALRMTRRDGKGYGNHRRGQYANDLKWPNRPPQTPHLHPRPCGRVSLYATHTQHVADPTVAPMFRVSAYALNSHRLIGTVQASVRNLSAM